MAASVRVGKYLTQLRERAGFKQNELAQQMTWSPAVLSRVESGEREISSEELADLLTAIGTEEAKRFAETITRDWANSPEPTLGHPAEELLWKAELALRDIDNLLESPEAETTSAKRLWEYRSAVKTAADLAFGVDYNIAFIGDIGVGKSTAICRATGLEVQDNQRTEPVLEAGAGGITICEVHLVQGPEYGIFIEPLSDMELRREVSEFAHYQFLSLDSESENAEEDQEIHGTTKEIERAIRNMSGLRSERIRTEGGVRNTVDHAGNLARDFKDRDLDPDALTVEILSRVNLHQRTRREVWYSAMSGKGELRWLRDTFSDINNGRNPDFSLPKRIGVIMPKPVIEDDSLAISIVDTKGIDGTAEREDLEFHLNDPRTVAILCSRFNDAPSSSAQRLLDRAVEGQFPDVESKAAVLVLPRPEEALAVKTDQGEPAEDTEDGYDLKGEQTRMILRSRNLPAGGLEFFNVREDDLPRLNSFLVARVKHLRALHIRRLDEVVAEANALVENFEREQKSETLRTAAHRLQVWIEGNRELQPSSVPLERSLVNAIREVYASSVQASVRRRGEWSKLDYSHQMGFGVRVKALRAVKQKQQEFKATAKNVLDDPQMEEAHGLISQVQRLFDSGIDSLLRSSQQMGRTVHRNDMQPDSTLWARCVNRWGLGSGYRSDVMRYHEEWFEKNRPSLEPKVQNLVEREWDRLLNRISELLVFE